MSTAAIQLKQRWRGLIRWFNGLGTSDEWRRTSCLFVLSTGRTGTDTLAQLLSLSDRINAFHEPHPELKPERKEARVRIDQDPGRFIKIFVAARRRAINDARLDGRIYAETSARLTFFVPVIKDLLPNARFIFMHRHPGDIVRSGIRRKWYDNHPADKTRIQPVSHEPAHVRWGSWSPFEKICWYWDAYIRFSLQCRQIIPADRWMDLKSNDFFSADPKTIRSLFEFVGAPAPSEDQIRNVMSSKHNAQHQGDFPVYEQWTPQQKIILRQIAGDSMKSLGYE